MVFKTVYRLMQVKSIAECSKGSILQYFLLSLSYHKSLRSSVVLSIFEWPVKTGIAVYSGPRGVKIGMSLHLCFYFLCASSKSSYCWHNYVISTKI